MTGFAVIDSRMSAKCKSSLKQFGFKLIEVPESSFLDKPISAHPDIFLIKYKNYIIAEQTIAKLLREHMFVVGQRDYVIIETDLINDNIRYPDDCALNFAVCGNHLIGNKRYANSHLINIAYSNKLDFIDVKQGYAKCNICVVNNNAIITEDKGIAKACAEAGINVLLLETNAVNLNGYKYGFIGGASGTLFDESGLNTVFFCGNASAHPEYSRIKTFCNSHGAEVFSLSDEDLYDYGSIILL